MSITSHLRCSLWLIHPCQQKVGLTIVLQNTVLLSHYHMPVFLYAHTNTEDALGAYLTPDTAVLMDVLCIFIFLSLLWILLLSWLPAVTAPARYFPDTSYVSSWSFWEWLFLSPQITIKNNPSQELWKGTHLTRTLFYFSLFLWQGRYDLSSVTV